MKYLYKIGLILSVVLTAGACSGQLDTIQEYLDAGETIYAAKWILLTYVLDIIG